MPVWLQILVACCATAITVGGLLVTFGRESGVTQEKIDSLEHEITRLREWRHAAGNFQQAVQLVNVFHERLERLERKVFNGQR